MRGSSAAAVAALSGFAVMSVELTAVRLFAPHFGDSAYVWTNVIGVLLVALALGAWLGGRAASTERVSGRLALVLTVAGALTVVVPLFAGRLGGWLLPADLPLDAAMPALVRGSLAATLIAFAPPVLLAGMVTPMLVVALVAGHAAGVGRAAGLVASWSTLGSLAGTFATTHLLVPGLGSRATVWLCAGLWLVAGALCAADRRRALLILLPLGLALVPWGQRRPVEPPAELLAEVESPYQFLQVVRTPPTNGDPATTALKINEGLDSFHSVELEGTPWTGGRYYDFHAAAPFFAGDGRRPTDLRVLSLGAAAGTFERIYHAAHPRSHVDSVELDPAVVELGRRWFDAFEEGERVFAGVDARVFVDHADERWDVVLVDAYERQIYVPAHVASREFFRAVEQRLEPGGVVSVNAGGRNFDDPVVRALGHTMAEVFGEAWAWRVPFSRNFVMLARRGQSIDPGVLDGVRTEDAELAAVVERMRGEHGWHRFGTGEPVLVDDRPFLDELQERALERTIGDDRPLAITGRDPVDAVEQRVYELALAGDWARVIEVAPTAEQPSPYLRLSLGDARFALHEVRGALAEWRAAAALGVEGATQEALQRRITDGEATVAALDAAADAADRNRLVAVLAAVVLLCVTAGVARRLRT